MHGLVPHAAVGYEVSVGRLHNDVQIFPVVRGRLHELPVLDPVVRRFVPMVEPPPEGATQLAQIVILGQALQPEARGQGHCRERRRNEEMRHPLAPIAFHISHRRGHLLEGIVLIVDVNAEPPQAIPRCAQVLLGISQHLPLESAVFGIDLEVNRPHRMFRMDDTDDLTIRLPDADGAQIDSPDHGMVMHVFPARLMPVDMPTRRTVCPHEEPADLLVVSRLVVVPDCSLHDPLPNVQMRVCHGYATTLSIWPVMFQSVFRK